jgi:hypothetical protein
VPKREKTTPQELGLQSKLETGMQFVAYYFSDDDVATLKRRLRLELAACLISAEHYTLACATSASTVIYAHIIKQTTKSTVDSFLRALHKITDNDPPILTIKYGSETEREDVFELRQEGKPDMLVFVHWYLDPLESVNSPSCSEEAT